MSSPGSDSPPLLLTRRDVASLLGIPVKQMTWWLYGFHNRSTYTQFTIARRSGGEPREIRAPIKPIKDMQRTLATVLVNCYHPPIHTHGFVLERSPVSNATRHQRQEWVLRVDLKDFFPSINFGRVRGVFLAYPFDYPEEVATVLAHICCYDNQLPQGAPTSPIISNLICRSLDRDLAQLSRAERCHFTRYADDICISTDRRTFPASLASVGQSTATQVGPTLLEVIRRNGFNVNEDKTRLMRCDQRQRVTGLVVNEKVNIPSSYIRDLRNVLHIWTKYSEEDAAAAFAKKHPGRNSPPEKPTAPFKSTIRGRVQYVGSIRGWSSPTYKRLALALQTVDPTFRPRTVAILAHAISVRIFTEGESDIWHLTAAQRYSQEQGDFLNLRLALSASDARGGDSELLKTCQGLALTPQKVPCVCVFDRDNPTVLLKAIGSGRYKLYDNDVAAIALAPPSWRSTELCVEMLYRDDDLHRTDAEGRRLFLSEEFDPTNGHHKSEDVHVMHPKAQTLVRDDGVFTLSGGAPVGLAKVAFAKAVFGRAAPFDTGDPDFEGFRPTFELLQEVAARMTT